MTEILVAVVPVRAGSQRVPNKNTRRFVNSTLLDLKLKVLSAVNGIDRVVVNTDCDQCESIARLHQVQVHRRDPRFASSSATNDQHWRHLAEVTECDDLLMAQVTSPLIRRSTFEQAISRFRSRDGAFDSLNSVTPERKFLWQAGQPLNYDPNRTPKSQDLPDIVSLNFAITLIEKPVMAKRGNVIGERPEFMALTNVESVDIDDQLDFEFAEFLYEKHGIDWLLE